MEQHEVVVIGAGPAGSTCAWVLARWGISVLLVDRDRFPRDKPCAGWITPAVLENLRIDPEEYAQGQLLQEIREFSTSADAGREQKVNYGAAVSYAIRRSEFDHYLLRRYRGPTRLGEPVQALERTADGWLVNGEIRARLLVGAGGHACPVARALGARPERERAIVALVAEYRMSPREEAGSPLRPGHTGLCFSTDSEGYGWLVRKGDWLNLGLGNLGGKDLRRRLDEYCTRLKNRGELLDEPGAPFRGHAYLPYRAQGGRRLVGDRALVIGDAAGLASGQSGEGILRAVESGILAAQTILCASADYRPRWLAPYAEEVRERYGEQESGWDRCSVPQGVKGAATRLVLGNPWLTRRLVLDRWFLHREELTLVPWVREGAGGALAPVAALEGAVGTEAGLAPEEWEEQTDARQR